MHLTRKEYGNYGIITTYLIRLEWKIQHSARYKIKKIKKGLKSGDQNRSYFFNTQYSTEAWSAQIGYEYHYDYPNHNDIIIRYFTKRGYRVEQSKFGKNLYIYRREI